MEHFFHLLDFNKNFLDFFYSFLLFIFLFSLYFIIYLFIKKINYSIDTKRKYLISLRNTFLIIFIISFIFLWGGAITTLMFSMAAIFATILIIFKELLNSILGYFLFNKIFSIGDYIEYESIVGKIIDKNLLNTTMLIVSSHNNKQLIFPNFVYLTSKITHLSTFDSYQSYQIQISVDSSKNIYKYSQIALDITKNELNNYKSTYHDYFNNRKKNEILFEIPKIEPFLTYNLSSNNNLFFEIHFISNIHDKDTIEQNILIQYLQAIECFT
jgi:hypothetical protein